MNKYIIRWEPIGGKIKHGDFIRIKDGGGVKDPSTVHKVTKLKFSYPVEKVQQINHSRHGG
jgi:hypothetical protein